LTCRVAVRFALGGDLRFLSHQDCMRLFERAAVRALLPLRWGKGFNPRPRVTLPLPRPLGTASDDELLLIELEQDADAIPLAPRDLLEKLAPQLPRDITLADAQGVGETPQPRSARYRVDLPPDHRPNDLPARIAALLASTTAVVERRVDAKGRSKPMDIRPFLLKVSSADDLSWLRVEIEVTPGGSARATEVLDALGLPGRELAHCLTREQVDWQIESPSKDVGKE
jgi:radical SAM-linked protein